MCVTAPVTVPGIIDIGAVLFGGRKFSPSPHLTPPHPNNDTFIFKVTSIILEDPMENSCISDNF